MIGNRIALGVYATFLLIILAINLLYIFQVLKYRLPGDSSLAILTIHIGSIIAILVLSALYLGLH